MKIDDELGLYGGILQLFILFAFFLYLIKLQRGERFEVTILISMATKNATFVVLAMYDGIYENDFIYLIVVSLFWSAGPIAHWTYASQYIKTCVLIPGLVDKVKLLMERH